MLVNSFASSKLSGSRQEAVRQLPVDGRRTEELPYGDRNKEARAIEQNKKTEKKRRCQAESHEDVGLSGKDGTNAIVRLMKGLGVQTGRSV